MLEEDETELQWRQVAARLDDGVSRCFNGNPGKVRPTSEYPFYICRQEVGVGVGVGGALVASSRPSL
jgi:hypothetical protein